MFAHKFQLQTNDIGGVLVLNYGDDYVMLYSQMVWRNQVVTLTLRLFCQGDRFVLDRVCPNCHPGLNWWAYAGFRVQRGSKDLRHCPGKRFVRQNVVPLLKMVRRWSESHGRVSVCCWRAAVNYQNN